MPNAKERKAVNIIFRDTEASKRELERRAKAMDISLAAFLRRIVRAELQKPFRPMRGL